MALVHQRFSTNTFPSWKLAHPYRFIAHNGEINTVRGNVNWMNARRRGMAVRIAGPDLDKMWPLIPHGQSDTACLDNALELLVAGGYPLAHAVMMLIPEAWAGNTMMDAKRKRFLRIPRRADGAVGRPGRDRLHRRPPDRRHARPQRPAPGALSSSPTTTWCILASESGVLPVPEEKIMRKWRLQPGKMLLIDFEARPHRRRRRDQEEIRRSRALRGLAEVGPVQAGRPAGPAGRPCRRRGQRSVAAARSASRPLATRQEDIQFFLEPMATAGDDPIGSMGTDTPIAVLSNKPKLLYNYFKQNFAQVTNPPIDPIREELVMSAGLDDRAAPQPAGPRRRARTSGWKCPQPVLTNADVEKIRSISSACRRRVPHRHHRLHLAGQRRRRRPVEGASSASA